MKILAVDFGDARTGLACCDRTEYLASPIGVLHDKDFGKRPAKKWPRAPANTTYRRSLWAIQQYERRAHSSAPILPGSLQSL